MLSKIKIISFISLFLVIALEFSSSRIALTAEHRAELKVYGVHSGVTTRYIGAVEGNVNFDLKDLQDLGINTYRIYGGMSRWEAEDDDEDYGEPSINEIKANPNLVNWQWWDKVMTEPPNGSDYWWSGSPGTTWQGNAREIFATLKEANIRPVLTIRNLDNGWSPSWAMQLNPPRTNDDWNEWWEHVFATVYWLNVRNDYQVDDFEIHNEPDNRSQGWGGNQSDYFELVKVAKDAIDHVYKTYLSDRPHHIHAPVTVGSSRWPLEAWRQIPQYFDSFNIHDYTTDISSYVGQVQTWSEGTYPIWLGEWGSYQNEYDSVPFGVNLINNMMRGSQPQSYVYGSHIFSLYDWGNQGKHQGLIEPNGERRISYYAFRMGVRCLQGGRSTFSTSTTSKDVIALTTQDTEGNIILLVTNTASESYTVNADLSELITNGTGIIWEFSSDVKDDAIAYLVLDRGRVTFKLPANAAISVKFKES